MRTQIATFLFESFLIIISMFWFDKFRFCNLAPNSKLAFATQILLILVVFAFRSWENGNNLKISNQKKGQMPRGRYIIRERQIERCINMRHAIWRNICWNLCLLFNVSYYAEIVHLRAEILPQWSIITRNTAWGKYSKTVVCV